MGGSKNNSIFDAVFGLGIDVTKGAEQQCDQSQDRTSFICNDIQEARERCRMVQEAKRLAYLEKLNQKFSNIKKNQTENAVIKTHDNTATNIPGNTSIDIPGNTSIKVPGNTTNEIPGNTTNKIPGNTSTNKSGTVIQRLQVYYRNTN